MDIPCISLDIHGISTRIHMYGISKDIPYIYHTYTIYMDEDPICMVYTIHIPYIYQKSGFQMFFPESERTGPPGGGRPHSIVPDAPGAGASRRGGRGRWCDLRIVSTIIQVSPNSFS